MTPFVLSSVCCSTGVGDAVQDRHDSTVCLVDPVCGFIMLNVVVLSSMCCSTGVGDAVQDRHDFTVCLVDPLCGFVMLSVVVLFCVLFNCRW